MADFLKALAFTLVQEGGWCNTPGDSGGETYRGISRNNFPSWEGWPMVDDARAWPEFPHNLASNAPLQDAVIKFYQQSFWSPLYGQIQDQAIATKIFDLGVNEGRKEISLITQRACNDAGQPTDVDGKFGNGTLKSINAANAERLLELIKFHANKFYDEIEETHPSYKKKFDRNWRKRVLA